MVEVWELSSDDESSLIWNIRSTKVSIGNTAGLCAIVAKEKGEVTEWNLQGPKQCELPCDFIAYFELVQGCEGRRIVAAESHVAAVTSPSG